MDNYLYEGQVERLNTCIIAQSKPLIIAEQHYLQRLKVDRNFIDIAKIPGLDTDRIQADTIQEVAKLRNEFLKIWKSKNSSSLNVNKNKPLPRLNTCLFVLYQQYPIKYTDPNTKKDREYLIEISTLITVGHLYSITYADELNQAWKRGAFTEVNTVLASKAPSQFSPLVFKQMNYNTPYLFIETSVPSLVHPTNAKWGFRNKKVDKEFPPIVYPTIEIPYLTWDKIFRKVNELPAMKGNFRLAPNKK